MFKLITSRFYGQIVCSLPAIVGIAILFSENYLNPVEAGIIGGLLIGGSIMPIAAMNTYKKITCVGFSSIDYEYIIVAWLVNTFGGPFKFYVALFSHAFAFIFVLVGFALGWSHQVFLSIGYVFGPWISLFYAHSIMVVVHQKHEQKNLPLVDGNRIAFNGDALMRRVQFNLKNISLALLLATLFNIIITIFWVADLANVINFSVHYSLILVGCALSILYVFIIKFILIVSGSWLSYG